MIHVDRRSLLAIGAGAVAGPLIAATSHAAGPHCRLLRPGDPGYAAEVAPFDLAQIPAPGLVVAAETATDVRYAVRLASRRGAPIAVLATGHQPSVPIGPDAILVSTRALRGVTVDARRRVARVEAGVRWQEVVDRAAAYGLAPLSGSSGTVGVVGYTLGGGLSPTLGRRFGYAADHVRAIDVVTADGCLTTVTPDADPGLFFGLRGGKSNFGLVTAIEFALFPVTGFYGGALYYDGAHARTVLHAYRKWIRTVPDAMSSSVALQNLPDAGNVPAPLRGRPTVAVRIAWTGSPAEGVALVRPLRAIAPPVLDAVSDQPYTAFGAIHADPVTPVPAVERTALLGELTADTVDALLATAGPGTGSPIAVTEIRHLGGALACPPRHPNAVAQRDAAFTLFMVGMAGPDQAAAVRSAEAAVIDRLRPWCTGGLFPNFLSIADTDPDVVRRAYPPEVYRRLRLLKRRVDPGNLFRLNHNIPPA